VLIDKQGVGKYKMRIYEVISKPIKPKQPLSAAQARINGLKNNVEKGRQQLQAERVRQQQQRENQRRQKQQQQQRSASV
jgi:vacuolar-type H+-ATPase subunit I/STV1